MIDNYYIITKLLTLLLHYFLTWSVECIHIRGQMTSCRFEISSRRENKFCSYDVSFRLHFTMTIFWSKGLGGWCLNEFQAHMCIKRSIQRECTYSFRFAQGKFCSHENLMPVLNFIFVKMSFILPQLMWKQVKSWLNTKVRF